MAAKKAKPKRQPKPGRDAQGRLLPGHTANPGGRPTIPEWFRARGPDALTKLLKVMDGDDVDEKMSPAQAAVEVVDRLYGRAKQSVDVGGDEGGLLKQLLSRPAPPLPKVDDEDG